MGEKKKSLGIIVLMFFGLVIPIITVMFSKLGLDRYKEMKAEMTFLKDSLQIKEFDLISQSNQPITKKDADGKVFIINYLDTDCSDAALLNTLKEMKRVQAEYKKEDERKILFLTHLHIAQSDSITKASQYAEKYGIDTSNWKIVTSPQHKIPELVKTNYKLSKEMGYSTLAVVDPRGYLCNHYDLSKEGMTNRMMTHMTVLIPVRDRKHIEYKADKNLYD